jgi:hypothetical protein
MNRKSIPTENIVHDPYKVREKYQDPSVCEDCRVVFSKGIFKWETKPPKNAYKMNCPACLRIRDNFEGGLLFLEGTFLENHKDELINLVKNTEKLEKATHPMERVMEIKDNGDTMEIKTTYEHLARRIGDSIEKAYKGVLNYNYLEDKHIRINWKRDS